MTQFNISHKIIIATTLATLSLQSGAAMLTSFGDDIKVQYHSSELDQSDSTKALYGKLRSAAAQACGPRSVRITGSSAIAAENRACYSDRLDNAVAEVGHAALTRLHND